MIDDRAQTVHRFPPCQPNVASHRTPIAGRVTVGESHDVVAIVSRRGRVRSRHQQTISAIGRCIAYCR